MPHPLVQEILFTRSEITQRSKELAQEISDYYRQQDVEDNTVLFVGLLKGCIPFMAEFMNHFSYECETDYMVVSSYQGGTTNISKPQIVLGLNSHVQNRHILIIEDVIDSGSTLTFVKKYLESRGAREVRIVTLIDKPKKRLTNLQPNWSGFVIDDKFLIGFGLDYQERLRNLPYIASCNVAKLPNWRWKKL